MGCNCKGKAQVLNNLNSKDHLNLVKDIYDQVIKGKNIEQYDDADKHQVIQGFYSLYPNVKVNIDYKHAVQSITNVILTQT